MRRIQILKTALQTKKFSDILKYLKKGWQISKPVKVLKVKFAN